MDLTLCLTHNCNLRCRYCYAGRKRARTMAWEVAEAAIRFGIGECVTEARRTGRPPELTLGFFGGEPLLERELLQRADAFADDACRRAGIALRRTLTTNMTLLDAEMGAWLLERGYWLGLSIDGNAAMHDTLRRYAGGKPTHADCVRALALFEGHENRAQIVCVIDPAQVRHLADGVRWLAASSRLPIALNPNFSADWKDGDLDEWREQYNRVGDFYLSRFRDDNPVRINVFDGKIRARVQGGYRACDRCGMGETEAAVAVSGRLYPCARLVGDDDRDDICLGDVRTGFDAARRLAMIARRGNRNLACVACSLRTRCMNWCGCVNYVTSGGDIGMAGPLTCWHEKLSAAVADRVAACLWQEQNAAFLARFYGGENFDSLRAAPASAAPRAV